MLADDLVGLDTLDPLRPGVPARPPGRGVEHVDGIIGDAARPAARTALRSVASATSTLTCSLMSRGDLRIADEVAVDANGIDHHMGEKTGCHPAKAPAAILEFSLGRGGAQCPIRQPAGAILLGVKAAEVSADDLGGRIALEALRARFQLATRPSASSI